MANTRANIACMSYTRLSRQAVISDKSPSQAQRHSPWSQWIRKSFVTLVRIFQRPIIKVFSLWCWAGILDCVNSFCGEIFKSHCFDMRPLVKWIWRTVLVRPCWTWNVYFSQLGLDVSGLFLVTVWLVWVFVSLGNDDEHSWGRSSLQWIFRLLPSPTKKPSCFHKVPLSCFCR